MNLTIKQALSRAKKATTKGKVTLALELYNAVLQHQPNHPVAKKGLHKLQKEFPHKQSVQIEAASPSQEQINTLVNFFHSGLMIEAEQSCNKLLQAYPQSLVVINILGAVLQAQGKLQEAVKIYEKAIQLKPDFAEAYFNRGNALKEIGQLELAVESYEKAIQFKPDYAMAYSNRGNILQELGQLTRAIESHDEAIQLKPDYAEAYCNRGNALKEIGQLTQAEKSYETAIQFKPDFAMAYCNRGNVLKELGQLDEAARHMQIAVEKCPNNAQVSGYLVDLLNYYTPSIETRGTYAKVQESLSQVFPENRSTLKITDDTVRQLYQQCDRILTSNNFGINSRDTQLFRGIVTDMNCRRHKLVFDKFDIIPEYCFNCYKVTLKPRTVMELFKVILLFDRLKLPNDNTRKCMVEVRTEVSGTYKGFIYCQSLYEANEILPIVQKIVDKTIAKGISIVVKMGCSEFQDSYPEYGQITNSGTELMTYKEEWRKHEEYVDKKLICHQDHNPNNFTHNHSGFTLHDVIVMRNWLAYAQTIGDNSYLKIIEH